MALNARARTRARTRPRARARARANARAWPWTKLRAKISRRNERSRHDQRICKHMRRKGNDMQTMDKTRQRAITKGTARKQQGQGKCKSLN